MSRFVIYLHDATQHERIDEVTSFVAEDASGSFGIQAGHARMMTTLIFGLARYRRHQESWEYLALPGALLYFHDNQLYLSTRHYLRDHNYGRIMASMDSRLKQEEQALSEIKGSLQRMEDELFNRLRRIHHAGFE